MNESSIASYYLFDCEGKLIHAVELSETFLRPVYQYTHQEIRNVQREQMQKEIDGLAKEG